MRTLFISLALLAVSMVAKAQNVESIFEQFRNHENVELVDVPKELLALGLKASGDRPSACIVARRGYQSYKERISKGSGSLQLEGLRRNDKSKFGRFKG